MMHGTISIQYVLILSTSMHLWQWNVNSHHVPGINVNVLNAMRDRLLRPCHAAKAENDWFSLRNTGTILLTLLIELLEAEYYGAAIEGNRSVFHFETGVAWLHSITAINAYCQKLTSASSSWQLDCFLVDVEISKFTLDEIHIFKIYMIWILTMITLVKRTHSVGIFRT